MITIKRNKPTFTLTIDGKPVQVSLLGRGLFSTVYSDGATAYIVTPDDCWDKDMMVEVNRGMPGPYYPAVIYAGDTATHKVYTCPVYSRLRAANKTAWKEYAAIQAAYNSIRSSSRFKNNYDGAAFNQAVLDKLSGVLNETALEELTQLVGYAANYGASVWLDINKRNFAVNGEQLIFLDLFADADSIEKKRR